MKKNNSPTVLWLLTAALTLLAALPCAAQNLAGYWQGMLHVTGKDSLTIGMFVRQQGDTLNIVLDSPDQYALDIPVDGIGFADSILSWKVPSINASFAGRLSTDGQRIEGTFKQGRSLPLTLARGFERKVIHRPQTPQPPYPYREEEIRIKESRGRYDLISGTLTMPMQQPKALAVMISGSGWQDRDESLFGHKPFKVLADMLTRRGYAVFRYDDYPAAVFARSTTFDFADGVALIMDTLSRRIDLQGVPIGLLGHSEGSLVAEIAASRDRRVAFIVTLGGVAQTVPEVLLYQLRAIAEAEGTLTPEEIEHSVALSDALYRSFAKAGNAAQAANVLDKAWTCQQTRLTPEQQQRYGFTDERKRTAMQQMCSPWFFAFFRLQPKQYLKRVKCPVLAIGGDKDLQVDAKANNDLFAKYLPKNSRHRFVTVPDANHLLQPCKTGSPKEYGEIEETIIPAVLDTVADWLDGLFAQP